MGATETVAPRVPSGRLVGWLGLVGVLAALSYASRLAGGETADDILYRWDTAAFALLWYAIILAVALALCRGLRREQLGLRRPPSWGRAAGLVAGAYVAVAVVAALMNLALEAGEEQGLVPGEWDSDRAAPFVANFVVVALVAPVVEELVYRGVGIAVTAPPFGTVAAIAITAAAFGLAHGLLVALPILTLFGAVLAFVRVRTASLYPAIALHAVFNSVALILAVTLEVGS